MNDVARWLASGAGAREGLRLLSAYAPNPALERLVKKRPDLFGHLLKEALEPFAEGAPSPQPVLKRGVRFWEQWPFLSSPDCPMELKVLAADKITAYRTMQEMHRKLSSCTTLEECFETAKNLLKNFRQNRQISAEFAYYKENGHVLGKHPIFRMSARMEKYRSMSIPALIREKRRLEGAIWRAGSEIRKGDKPHLTDSRESRIQEKKQQLSLVNRLIEENDRHSP